VWKASLSVKESKPGKEKLKLVLKNLDQAVGQADFGDPATGDTSFDACIYSDVLVAELSVARAGQLCGPKQKPCWKAKGDKGYVYKDLDASAAGIKKIAAIGGPERKGKLQAQAGNNVKKAQTDLPTGITGSLQGATSATVQVLASDGLCFEAALATVKKADGDQFKAKAP